MKSSDLELEDYWKESGLYDSGITTRSELQAYYDQIRDISFPISKNGVIINDFSLVKKIDHGMTYFLMKYEIESRIYYF